MSFSQFQDAKAPLVQTQQHIGQQMNQNLLPIEPVLSYVPLKVNLFGADNVKKDSMMDSKEPKSPTADAQAGMMTADFS